MIQYSPQRRPGETGTKKGFTGQAEFAENDQYFATDLPSGILRRRAAKGSIPPGRHGPTQTFIFHFAKGYKPQVFCLLWLCPLYIISPPASLEAFTRLNKI